MEITSEIKGDLKMSQTNVLKNYKIIQGKNLDEFPAIKVKYNDEDVFVEQPICKCPYPNQLIEPYLIVDQQGMAIAVEKKQILDILSKTKIFYFGKSTIEGDMSVVEVEPGKHVIAQRLPKDTDITKLGLIGDQIVMLPDHEDIKVEGDVN